MQYWWGLWTAQGSTDRHGRQYFSALVAVRCRRCRVLCRPRKI